MIIEVISQEKGGRQRQEVCKNIRSLWKFSEKRPRKNTIQKYSPTPTFRNYSRIYVFDCIPISNMKRVIFLRSFDWTERMIVVFLFCEKLCNTFCIIFLKRTGGFYCNAISHSRRLTLTWHKTRQSKGLSTQYKFCPFCLQLSQSTDLSLCFGDYLHVRNFQLTTP